MLNQYNTNLKIMVKEKQMNTENTPQIINNFPSQIELQSVALIAKTAHLSNLYSGIGGEAKIMMILLTAKELGVGPCQALNGGIWSIQGKVEISARLMNGLIRRAGHSIKVVTSTDTECRLLGTRSDGDSFECTFTIDDAIKAGLAGANVWKKYPSDMLYNRCMSRLGRRLFSDVIGQCYIEGEIKEAKEIEKQEKQLEQAECEEIKHNTETLQTFTLDKPQDSEESQEINEPKISFEDMTEFMKFYALTNDIFKENFDKFIKEEWGVTQLENIPAKHFAACMRSMSRNIESRQG